MAIASYLVFTQDDEVIAAFEALRSLPFCEPYLSDDRRCLVLVTETPDEDAESFLQGQFGNLVSITGMAMVCGFQNEQDTDTAPQILPQTEVPASMPFQLSENM